MAPPLSHHHLVIVRREPGGDLSTLLLDGPEGWTLPRLQSKERRSADVSDLTREARDTLGLEVSVLQCLSDEPAEGEQPRRQLYLLEAHGTGHEMPGRWIPRRELEATVPPSSAARWAFDAWLRATPSTSASDWARPGWRDEVLAWVDGQLSGRGCATVRAVEATSPSSTGRTPRSRIRSSRPRCYC